MSENILERVLLPIVGPKDARTTCELALPRIAGANGSVICVNVVEKGGGSLDPTSPTQQEERAEEVFEIVAEECEAKGIPLETRILYGTDVAETIFEAAEEEDVTAIAFTPRESNRLVDILSGSPGYSIMKRANRPVVVFPSRSND
ncbi:universal stress protein [Halalkalicoccus ordinarius]|uniref:universal stress protein n=1 Tax=Halalkalicoccus ordinarius TaxID=3116651 RepID=UPI00300ECF92